MRPETLTGFKSGFTKNQLHNLLIGLSRNLVVLNPETAPNTDFILPVGDPTNQSEVNYQMTQSQQLLSMLAVQEDDEKNLFDRILKGLEIQGQPAVVTSDGIELDDMGNARIINDQQQYVLMTAEGYVTNNRDVCVVILYPKSSSLVYVDFIQETLTRVSFIPKELIH